MRASRWWVGMLTLLLVLGLPGAAVSAPASGAGVLRLDLSIPDESTVLVEIVRVDASAPARVVVHSADEPAVKEVELAQGTYRIVPRASLVDGQRYVGRSDPMQVRIRAGRVSTSEVVYRWSRGIQDLQVTQISDTSVSFAWSAQRGEGTTVWRVEGDTAPERPGRGVELELEGTELTDDGLMPGTTYSYAFFARPGDGAFGRTDGDPVTITVGTAADQQETGQATFVAAPGTIILSIDDVVTAVPTGDGVQLTLRSTFSAPVPGTILSVPAMTGLDGGYLGEVVGVSQDGRTVLLEAAPLGAAFDLYYLDVPEFGEVADGLQSSSALLSTPEVPGEDAIEGLSREARARASRDGSGSESPVAPQMLVAPQALNNVACSASSGIDVNSSLSISHAGHSEVTIDKYSVWKVDVPSGASFDVSYSATLLGTVGVEATGAANCSLNLPKYYKQLTLYPVPMAIEVDPKVDASMASAGSISNVGFAATTGFRADGYIGFTGDNNFKGDIIATATPTQPVATGTFTLGLEVGANVKFGPGVGSNNVGVLLAVGGYGALVDGSFGVETVATAGQTATCIELDAASSFDISATAKAWLPGYSVDYSYGLIDGSKAWPGTPWSWPTGCKNGGTPTDDVVGDGVTVISDDLSGLPAQWGKVEGFVPGENTWILSTGRVQDAVGHPSFFASTNLGGPGDPQLTALSGFPTYDAAAYTVTVVPNGQTLNVRYVFASEEYPEYVGSQFNDVMAVFIDGENCALVPGTSLPVSINTINHLTNSQYYVDNQFGAAGYGTTMDGLTTPLTCTVPVTPGQPVTIRIAVADASDAVWDSAVALLDGGIWSE
jgi:hypothetical protein